MDSQNSTKGNDESVENEAFSSCDIMSRRWRALPDDICLSIVARLSWEEICCLSCTWKQLWEAFVLQQTIFEEYAESRVLKPVCILHGFVARHWRYRMIAGDSGHSKPHQLLTSKSRDVLIGDKDIQQLMPDWQAELFGSAAGCFVLLKTSVLLLEITSCKNPTWVCLNPTNGTARKIYSQVGSTFHRHSGGIFNDGDSHYQILDGCYKFNRHARRTYNRDIPQEEDLGRLTDEANDDTIHPRFYHYIFYLYKSRTKSWSKLLECNLRFPANLDDPVVYKGVIHCMLSVSIFLEQPAKKMFEVYYVDEISGRKRWMLFEVRWPRETIHYAHLFTFQEKLMLAALLEVAPAEKHWKSGCPSTHIGIWNLHEESRTWVRVSSIPDDILHSLISERCCSGFESGVYISSNAGYVTVRRRKASIGLDTGAHCVVMCDIATNHWQVVHMHEESDRRKLAVNVAIFEPRFDISA